MPYVNVPNDLCKNQMALKPSASSKMVPDDGRGATGSRWKRCWETSYRARFCGPESGPIRHKTFTPPLPRRGAARKEDAIENSKKPKARPRKGRSGKRPCPPSRRSLIW